MNASLDMARDANAQQLNQDVQSRVRGLQTNTLSPQAKEKKLREACEGFESIFIQNMWKEMRKTVNQSTLLHGKEEQFWQDMYDQELAKKMTSAGGIGLAQMMYEQLSSHLTSASRSTAMMGSTQQVFVPAAAPLLKEDRVSPASFEEQARVQLHDASTSIYEEAPKQAPLHDEKEPAENAQKDASQEVVKVDPQKSDASKQKDAVDPRIEAALAVMRSNASSNVGQNVQANPALAQVNYSAPMPRQQPVATGLDMVNAVRRQAGDQLGSRGVREPLLPQTEAARNVTQQAYERRGERNRVSTQQVNAQQTAQEAPQSAFAPMTQIAQPESPEAQETLPQASVVATPQPASQQTQPDLSAQANAAPQTRRVTYITNKPQSQHQKNNQNPNRIRTLTLDGNRTQEIRQSQGTSTQRTIQVQNPQNPTQQATQVQVQPPETLNAPENLGSIAQRQSSDTNTFSIPPLTAQDLRM